MPECLSRNRPTPVWQQPRQRLGQCVPGPTNVRLPDNPGYRISFPRYNRHEKDGINLSDDYTKEDISCLITRAVHEEDRDDMIPVDLSLAKMVADHNICLSVFSGEKRALNALWFQLSKEEQLRFFIFCIHQNRLKCHSYDLEHSPYLDYYDRFVKEYKDNESLRRSLSGYVGSDLSLNKKPNKQRNAYKIANEFLIK